MKTSTTSGIHAFSLALEAIHGLTAEAYYKLDCAAGTLGLKAHSEIKHAPVTQKSAAFYSSFLPLREQMVTFLADSYRKFLRLGLAHSNRIESVPDQWAWTQLQPALCTALRWICEWYILACEGENQSIRTFAVIPVVQAGTISLPIPSTVPQLPLASSWRAPAWLFGISLTFYGIGGLKQNHVPRTDSEKRLGEAHTRLLLKGARRVLLWDLGAKCQTVRNEEIAAYGTNRVEPFITPSRRPNKRKGWQQRNKLYETIRKVLVANPQIQGIDFCAELDKRHAPPHPDWVENGEWREDLTWKEAWKDKDLRRKIRRVRQEALKTN
jgi:hypothetical protein